MERDEAGVSRPGEGGVPGLFIGAIEAMSVFHLLFSLLTYA